MSRHDPTRLQHLVGSYYKSDLERIHKNYERICEKYYVEKKDFLNDVSLYNHCDVLSVSNISATIRNESLRVIPIEHVENFKKRKRNHSFDEDNSEEEQSKSAKSSNKTCSHCGGSEFIFVCNGNSDCMYLEFPNGRTISGQTPQLTAITDNDGVALHVCIGCGMVHGFNSTQLKQDLERYEFALEDMDETDQDELLFEE